MMAYWSMQTGRQAFLCSDSFCLLAGEVMQARSDSILSNLAMTAYHIGCHRQGWGRGALGRHKCAGGTGGSHGGHHGGHKRQGAA